VGHHWTDAAGLRTRFYAQLPDGLRECVERVVAAAPPVWLAGGGPRDLLLGRPLADVDLLTGRDAPAAALAVAPADAVTVHERFRTASIAPERGRIDITTVRSETYAHPGALPDVRPGSIDDDMRRRDFSINAMALRLDGEPALVDPCGGARDIDARLVRALHDGSFRDDATRIMRAFRYAARLGFTIEPHTRGLIDRDVEYVQSISGERLSHELRLLFQEPAGGEALAALDAAKALAQIHPALHWHPRATIALAGAPADAPPVEVGFALLGTGATAAEAARIAARLDLTRSEAAAVRGVASLARSGSLLRRRDVRPSGVVALFDRYPLASVVAFVASADGVAAHLLREYIASWRHERPLLNGDDVMRMGVPEGPQVGRALQLVRAARLDGWAADRDDERALVLRFAKSIRDSHAMKEPLDFKPYEN